jgi:hypothetical protein
MQTKNVSATLDQRGSTHGDFSVNSQISQDLKDVMAKTPNWANLTADKKEALHMIQHKIARILSGDAEEPDHYHDIAGYATLAERRCAKYGIGAVQSAPVKPKRRK